MANQKEVLKLVAMKYDKLREQCLEYYQEMIDQADERIRRVVKEETELVIGKIKTHLQKMSNIVVPANLHAHVIGQVRYPDGGSIGIKPSKELSVLIKERESIEKEKQNALNLLKGTVLSLRQDITLHGCNAKNVQTVEDFLNHFQLPIDSTAFDLVL